jgi:hypothetical protein
MSSGRGVLSAALIAVAAVLLPVSVLAYWGHGSVLDRSAFSAAVSPVATDPQVRDTVADALSARATSALTSSGILASLPPVLAGLGDKLGAVVGTAVHSAATAFVGSDAFRTAWTQSNLAAQQALVQALNSPDAGGTGDKVVLDTGDLLTQLRDSLAASGLPGLSQVPLPDAASQQVVLVDDAQLARLATSYRVLDPVAPWLVYAVLALFALAVLVAARRLLALAWCGVALLLGAGALVLADHGGQEALAGNLSAYSLQALAAPYWSALAAGLHTWTLALAVLGAVLLLVGAGGVLLRRGH